VASTFKSPMVSTKLTTAGVFAANSGQDVRPGLAIVSNRYSLKRDDEETGLEF
jgi:hypothetical protein